jgi:hypothetical protein
MEPLEDRRVLAAISWDGGGDGTSWHDAVNWSSDAIPGASDDVTIDVAGTPTIAYTTTTGNRSVNSLVCRETINFTGGRLSLLTTASMEGATTLNGGSLSGGAWTMVGAQLLFTSNGNNALVGPITITGDLAKSGSNGFLSVTGGLTLNGTLFIQSNDTIDFGGTQTFSNGTIDFVADNTASHTLRVSGADGSTLTIAANAQITGGTGSSTSFVTSTGTGTQAILNLGTINADNPSAGLQITADSFTNQGTVRASNSGTLTIAATSWNSSAGSLGADNGTLNIGGAVTTAGLGLPNFFRNAGAVNITGAVNNAAATMTLNAQTGTFTLNGGTISGGTLTMTGGAQLLFTSNGNNALVGPITVTGDLAKSGSNGFLSITGGLTLNGTLSIQSNDTIDFGGTQTFSNGTIDFVADNTASHTLRVSGADGSTLTIAANAQITGGTGSSTSFVTSTGTGTQAILNLGTINADNPSAGIQITADSFTNQGTVRASNSGTLTIAATSWNSSAGSLGADNGTLNIGGSVSTAGLGLANFFRNAGAVNITGTVNNAAATMTLNAQTGTFTLNGGTISGGTLTMTGGAQLLFTSNGNNALVGPITVTGDLAKSGSNGFLSITGGLTLNGTLSIQSNDTIDFGGTQTFSNGTIDFVADNTASHTLRVSGADGSTLTIAANAQITGGTGSSTSFVTSTGTGTQAILNLGTINADNPSAGLQITADGFTNQGTIGATGGTLTIDPQGSGTTWTNDGTIALNPGGKVAIVDNLVLAATSTVHLSAQGAGAANYGVLSATGTIAIAGGFTGSYINAYVPAEGTFFDFLTATGGRSGQFTTQNLPTPPAGDKTVLIYEATRVRMLSTDLADLDLNGLTNTQDFLLYLNLWASGNISADMDGNGVVDTRDFLVFLNLWANG